VQTQASSVDIESNRSTGAGAAAADPRSVAVVGASAAGLHLAALAADQGYAVTVYERARRLDPFPRALIVTARVRDSIGDTIDAAVTHAVARYELFADGRSAQVELSEPDLVIDRSRLIHRLAELAEQGGVTLRYGARLADLKPDRGGVRMAIDGDASQADTLVARTVVGADGANSAVARRAGWVPAPTASLVQAVVKLPRDMAADTARVWFRPQDTTYFYWLIPDSAEQGVLGLIADEPHTARGRLDAFVAEQGFETLGYQAARIPVSPRWVAPHRRMGDGDVFLVGDAAAHVKISTVGGIHTGFLGAQAVAARLSDGSGRELRMLRRELTRHQRVRRALHRFDEGDYRKLLALLGPTTQALLGRHTRDDSRRLLWRLCAREPRFVLLAARGLLSRSA
jgi:geranylgeranyl diphosphate/geranylgeranyl-bacteriochlorophyllide a reductase